MMNILYRMLHLKLLFCIFFCRYAYGTTSFSSLTSIYDNKDWDILIFTQQWPAMSCYEWKEKNPSNKCAMPKNRDSWTVHGIWPTKLGTIGPAYCNRSWHFDPEQVKPIETELSQVWINVEKNTPVIQLWVHEWTKHGTCAAVLESLNSEYKYFSKGLEWISKFSMTNILSTANIIPSNTELYSVSDIYYVVRKTLNVNPFIKCRMDKGHNFLEEIRICFDKNLKLINCDGIMYSDTEDKLIGSCGLTQQVLYIEPPNDTLSHVTNSIYVQLYKLVSWLQWFTL